MREIERRCGTCGVNGDSCACPVVKREFLVSFENMGAAISVLVELNFWSLTAERAVFIATLRAAKEVLMHEGWSVSCHEVIDNAIICSPTYKFDARTHLKNIREKGGFQYLPGF